MAILTALTVLIAIVSFVAGVISLIQAFRRFDERHGVVRPAAAKDQPSEAGSA